MLTLNRKMEHFKIFICNQVNTNFKKNRRNIWKKNMKALVWNCCQDERKENNTAILGQSATRYFLFTDSNGG